MIAEKAAVENSGICGICKTEKDLTQQSQVHGAICEDCYLQKFQIGIPMDEYDLQVDELTKEQVAEKAGVTLRNVEIWKKEGKIPAEKLRRRVGGVVRKQLIFKVAEVEKFLNGQNQPVKIPTLELEKAKNEQTEFLNASQMFVAENLGKFADAMNQFTDTVTKQLPAAGPEQRELFIPVKQASLEYGISQAEIKHLITEKIIRGFTGSNGEIKVSRKQIENL
jgi:hypothetical protein